MKLFRDICFSLNVEILVKNLMYDDLFIVRFTYAKKRDVNIRNNICGLIFVIYNCRYTIVLFVVNAF